MVANLLDEATLSYFRPHHVESVLWCAYALDPTCLAVYFALYKFYFHRGRLRDSERVARRAVAESARQSGLPSDWRRVFAGAADFGDAGAPPHFFLFSLKALAFISLRLTDHTVTASLLDKLAELDPGDSVGASVVRELYLRTRAE